MQRLFVSALFAALVYLPAAAAAETLRLPTWQDFLVQKPKDACEDWKPLSQPAARADRTKTVGVLETRYDYVAGVPVRRDVAIAIEANRLLRPFYRLATTQVFVGGVVWQPLVGENGSRDQKAFFVGLRTKW